MVVRTPLTVLVLIDENVSANHWPAFYSAVSWEVVLLFLYGGCLRCCSFSKCLSVPCLCFLSVVLCFYLFLLSMKPPPPPPPHPFTSPSKSTVFFLATLLLSLFCLSVCLRRLLELVKLVLSPNAETAYRGNACFSVQVFVPRRGGCIFPLIFDPSHCP